jgi:hypothetical protein
MPPMDRYWSMAGAPVHQNIATFPTIGLQRPRAGLEEADRKWLLPEPAPSRHWHEARRLFLLEDGITAQRAGLQLQPFPKASTKNT